MSAKSIDPDELVADAEAEAQEAVQLAAALEQRARDGDDSVTFEQIQEQEKLGRWAQIRADAAKRKAANAREAVRQGELGIIRAEMDTYAAAEGEHFVGLLKGVETTVLAFAAAYVQHNQTVTGWRERMTANGVQPQGNRLAPSKTDQGLSLAPSGAVRAGGREFTQEFSGQVLQELLLALRGHDGISKNYFESDYVGHPKLDELYARVSSPVQESAGIPDDALFYRHTNGSVHMRGAESPIPVEDLKRLELRPIDRAEAVAE